jgi:hypothetical protein
MIVYDLVCAQGHRFEGWFASGEEFARQHEAKLVNCPLCDDGAIERVPSAKVSVQKGRRSSSKRGRPSSPPDPAQATPGEGAASPGSSGSPAVTGMPPEVLAKLREIVRQTENVGSRFPEEARKIHYEEIPARPIRGQASPEEAKALTDEGIEFAPVPPFLLNEPH